MYLSFLSALLLFSIHIDSSLGQCDTCINTIGVANTVAVSGSYVNELIVEVPEGCSQGPINATLSYNGVQVESTISTSPISEGYLLEYSAPLQGEADLTIISTATGENITGSPFRVSFINGAACFSNCSGRGACVSGGCICSSPYTGVACEALSGNATGQAYLVSSGLAINITFSIPLAPPNATVVDCASILSQETFYYIFASSASCTWTSKSTLLLVPLSYEGNLGVGYTFTFVDGFGVDSVQLSITPEEIENSTPVILIKASDTLSLCSAFYHVDASLTTNAGRYFSSLSWSLLSIDEDNSSSEFIALASNVSAFASTTMDIPTTLLRPDVTYNFRFRVTNFIGVSSSKDFSVQTYLYGPTVSFHAPNTIYARADEEISVTADVDTCSDHNPTLIYSWARVDPATHQNVPLGFTPSKTKVLTIPAGTFTPNLPVTLELSVVEAGYAQYVGHDTINIVYLPASSQPIAVQFLDSDINVNAPEGATAMTVSRYASFDLDISGSLKTSATYSINWECQVISPAASCEPCFDDDMRDYVFGTSGDRQKVVIPAATLHPGVYSFTATLQETGNQVLPAEIFSTLRSTVTIVPDRVPSVYALLQSQDNGLIQVAGEALSSAAFCNPADDYIYEWSVLLGDNELNLNDPSISSSGPNSNVLLLDIQQLTTSDLSITLKATDSCGTGSSQLQVRNVPAPIGGEISVSPSSGSTSTVFTISGETYPSSFQDLSGYLPLRYQFGYVTSEGTDIPLFARPYYLPIADAVLPINAVAIYVVATNTYGASKRLETPVSIGSSKRADSASYLAEAQAMAPGLEVASNQGDLDRLIQVSFSILGLLNSDVSQSSNDLQSRVTLRALVTQYVPTLLDSGIYGGASFETAIRLLAAIAPRPVEINATTAISLAGDLQTILLRAHDASYVLSQQDATDLATVAGSLSQVSTAAFSNAQRTSYDQALLQSIQRLAKNLLTGSTQTSVSVSGLYLSVARTTVESLTTPLSDPASGASAYLSAAALTALKKASYKQVDVLFAVYQNTEVPGDSSEDINSLLVLYSVGPAHSDDWNGVSVGSPVTSAIVLPYSDDWNYDEVCQSWSTSQGSWGNNSCSSVTSGSEGSVRCDCNSTTFSARYSAYPGGVPPIPNGALPVPISPALLAANINIRGATLWWLVVLIGGIALLAIAALSIYRWSRNHRMMLRKKSRLFVEEEPEPEETVEMLPISSGVNLTYAEELTNLNRARLYGNRSDSDDSVELRNYKIKYLEESSDEESPSEDESVEVPPSPKGEVKIKAPQPIEESSTSGAESESSEEEIRRDLSKAVFTEEDSD